MFKKLHKYSSKIIIIMALMLPFLDMYKAVIGNKLELFGISLVEIFNFSYVFILLLLLLNKMIIEKQKIFSFKYLLLIIMSMFFIICHCLYLPIINETYFNATSSYYIETYYIIRSYILPLLVLFVYMKSDMNKKDIIKILSMISFVYSSVIVITNIFGISFVGYASNYDNNTIINGGIFSWFSSDLLINTDLYTSKGWFYSTNQLSAILGSLLFLSAFYTFYKDKLIYYLSFLVKILAALMLSTKTAFFAIIFSISSIFIYQVLVYILYKRKEFTKKSIIFLIYLVFIIGLYNFSPIKYKLNNYINLATDDSIIEVDDNVILDCMSSETIYLKNNYALSIKSILKRDNISSIEKKYLSSFMSDCPTSFNLVEEYTSFYSVNDNFDFWLNLIKGPKSNMSNYRKVKKNIYSNYLNSHNNILDLLFGVGYTSNFTYIESDFYAQFVWFGLIGVLLFVMPYIFIIIKEIGLLIFNLKNKLNKISFAYLLTILYMIVASIVAGHVFGMFIPSVILSLLIKGFYNELNEKKLNNRKITFLLLHLGFGGIETATINTANELSKYYDIEIVSFYKLDKDQKDKINNKIKIKYLCKYVPNRKEFMESIHSLNIFKIIKESLKSIKILYLKRHLIIKEIKNSDSNYIVSTRNEYSVLLSKYGNKNTIKIAQEHRHHNNDKKYINNIKYKFNNIDYLFALTDNLKNDYERFLSYNKHTKVILVPNMIDLPNEKSNLKNKNLITISRLHPGKKIDEMIDIFSKIENKNIKLYIVGDGAELNNLKEIVNKKELTNRVIFTGYKEALEMKKYILDSAIFLMTSISEGLPMVLLEAMSYGLPCIAYKTESGVADIIDNDINGYIINNRNEIDYINKINELLENDKLLNELSINAIEKAKKFSKDNIILLWQSILK